MMELLQLINIGVPLFGLVSIAGGAQNQKAINTNKSVVDLSGYSVSLSDVAMGVNSLPNLAATQVIVAVDLTITCPDGVVAQSFLVPIMDIPMTGMAPLVAVHCPPDPTYISSKMDRINTRVPRLFFYKN